MSYSEHYEAVAFELANRSLPRLIIETSLLSIIALTALLGNSCVLYVFYKTPRLRTVTSIYLRSLAISDVALSVLVMPTSILTSAYGRNVLPDKLGKVVGWIFAQLVFVSLYTTFLIGINRFFCVVKPVLYKKYFKRKTVILTILLAWFVMFFFILVLYLSGAVDIDFYPGRMVYFLTFTHKTTTPATRVITAVSHFLLVLFPLTLAAISYWKLYTEFKGHSARVSSTLNAEPTRTTTGLTKEEIQLTRSVLSLVCGFIICWIPPSTLFHISIYIDLPRSLEVVIVYTSYIGSALNPILYNILNHSFRKRFLILICSRQNGAQNVQTQ